MRAILCHIRYIRLQENRLVRAQTCLCAHHTGVDERGNRSDDNLDGWVD